MKKISLILVVGLFLLSIAFPHSSEASEKATSYTTKVNNANLATTYGSTFVSNGTTYVPAKGIAIKMGDKASWSKTKQQVIITKKNKKTIITIKSGKSTATVNNKVEPLKTKVVNKAIVPVNAKAIVKNNVLYVPVEFVSSSNGLSYPVKTVKSSGKVTIYVGTLPATSVKKYGHMLSKQTIYTSNSSSSKSLGTISKNKNVYVYASQSGWYQVKIGEKKGWVKTSTIKMGKYVAPTTAGKKYLDGWVAPVLKSKWSSNQSKNFKAFDNELGFVDGRYSVIGKPNAIVIHEEKGNTEVMLQFKMWENTTIKQSYRIPVISKELFKFYFEKDANRVFNYFEKGDIPDKFVANGRTVKVSINDADASLHFIIGYKNKSF